MKVEKDIFVDYRCINGKKYIAKDNQVYQLDEVGEKVWNSLNGEISVKDIIDKISEEYAVEKHIVTRDIESYINELLEKDLVSIVEN